MKSISVDGVTRYYAEEGAGPAIILIHGSMSSYRQWRAMIDGLRDRYKVIAIDLLANGEDDATKLGAFSFAQDVALVETLIDENERPHLLGHSYGGVVAIKSALSRKDKLASLILIEPSCFHLLEGEPEHTEIVGMRDAQFGHEAQGDPMAATRGFIEYWIGPQAWTAMPERRKEVMIAGLPKLAQDWPGTLDPNTNLADYRNLTLPVLLIRAEDTRRPSYRIVDLIREELPDAMLAEIETGGHMSPLTNPGEVNEAVERFLHKLARRAGA